jgi:hypothetical protein
VVGEVIGALGEEHRRLVAQDDRDQHRRRGGFPVDDALLDLDLRLPRRRRDEAQPDRGRQDARGIDRREMGVESDDRQVLGIEESATSLASRFLRRRLGAGRRGSWLAALRRPASPP